MKTDHEEAWKSRTKRRSEGLLLNSAIHPSPLKVGAFFHGGWRFAVRENAIEPHQHV